RERNAVIADLALGQRGEECIALRRRELLDLLAVRGLARGLRRGEPGAKESRRVEGKLVALFRLARLPGAFHVETLAVAEATRQLAIHVGRESAGHTVGRQVVGRTHGG